jgi:hypothetical protein
VGSEHAEQIVWRWKEHSPYQAEKQTLNPPTPKASAWQAPTCLAVAPQDGTKEERPIQKAGSFFLLMLEAGI